MTTAALITTITVVDLAVSVAIGKWISWTNREDDR